MATRISRLSEVDPRAEIGEDVEIGPFCVVGPDVTIGDRCKLESHVCVVGNTTIGCDNHFFPNAVIGGAPQDSGYSGAPTRLEIGDHNLFREGVTVNRGAEKEDHVTRIGHHNMFMANAHVAHNCHIRNHVILVNGVLLGGHVHVHDRAIISGNCVVHHFSTLGTLSFVSGGSRVPHDVPPYMLSAGSDSPSIRTINIVGMQRSGMSPVAVSLIKRAYRLLYREFKRVALVREILQAELTATWPIELEILLSFVEAQNEGKDGRARERDRRKAA